MDCLDFTARTLCAMLVPAGDGPVPSPEADRLAQRIEALLEEFRVRRGGLTITAAAAEVFRELAQVPRLLHWDTGLRDATFDLVLASIYQAERFGPGTGEFKRRFTIDVVTRALRAYDPSGLVELVEDSLVAPIVGIHIDWTVEVLNLSNAWQPVARVQLPRFYLGRHADALRLAAWAWRALSRLRELFYFPSDYERQVRSARAGIEPQVQGMLVVFPRDTLHQTAELLLNVVARVGHLTAPHVRTLTDLLQLADNLATLDQREREEVVLRAALMLLRRAYREDSIALLILDSQLGRALVRQMLMMVQWVLVRNDLLPGTTRHMALSAL